MFHDMVRKLWILVFRGMLTPRTHTIPAFVRYCRERSVR